MFLRLLCSAAATVLLAASAAPAQTLSVAADDPVVARVNGSELHRSDLLAAQKQLPAQVQQMPLEQIYSPLLDQLVTGTLISEAGRKDKLADDPEVKKRTARLEDRVIQEVYVNRVVEQAATDDVLHKRYAQFVKDHPGEEEVHARHILLASEDEAKAVIAALDKGGDFGALAKEKSTDPSKDTGGGGDLGYFTRESMVPEFAEAAFNMKPGEYSKTPVHSQFGWHVIKVEDRRAGAPPSFEDSKEQMTSDIAREVIGVRIKELRSTAKIETFGLDGSPLPAKN